MQIVVDKTANNYITDIKLDLWNFNMQPKYLTLMML